MSGNAGVAWRRPLGLLAALVMAIGVAGAVAAPANADPVPGNLDTSFNDTLTNALATAGLDSPAMTSAWDGSGYLIAGDFTNAPGSGAGDKWMFRVKADSSPDTSFNDTLSTALAAATSNAGLNNLAKTVVWDGSGYVISGYFSNGPGSGAGSKRIFRVKADGSLDTGFNDTLSSALAAATGDAGLNDDV